MPYFEHDFYRKFIEILKETIPEKGKLCTLLVDLLIIEKEAVYRRLRGDVPFSFVEIVKISRHLNISIDNIIGLVSPYRNHPFHLNTQDYFHMTELDYKLSKDYIAALQAAGSNPYSEFGSTTSVLPMHTTRMHPPLLRFYVLKWMYLFGSPTAVLPYSKIAYPERLKEYHRQYIEAVQDIKYTYFICDELFLVYLTHDIEYFYSIHLLTDEDVAVLKEEIRFFLDFFEKLAIQGSFSNGNKMDLYISGVNFETSYSYLSSHNIHISMINAFTLGTVTSVDEQACEKMKIWMQALKRTSTLITGAEKNRILFFEKQRQILERI
jgi:hypothetical protein